MKQGFKRIVTGLCLLFLLPLCAPANQEPSAEERFFEANRAYKNGQFQQAVAGYQKLIAAGIRNGHLYYNLGNAYYRLGDPGRAILFYERARRLIPRNDDLTFNLAAARKEAPDDSEDPQTTSLAYLLGLDSVNLAETVWGLLLLNALFFALLCIRLFRRAEWSYYLSIFLAILLSIGACTCGLKWYEVTFDDRAVVLAQELAVRAGPDPNDTVLFKIHEGTLVHYERAEDGWILLHLSKDKRGWAESSHLGRIVL